MTEAPKLKPCPFCGTREHLMIVHLEGTIRHPAYKVHCDNCGGERGYTDSGEHVNDWNTRPLEQEAALQALASDAQAQEALDKLRAVEAERDALRIEARRCFDAQHEIDDTWDAIGTRGNPQALTLAEQVSSIIRELDAALTATPAPSPLTVWYGSMPESNGKRNWTASLHRRGEDAHMNGFCFARSEYAGRVRYEADRMRWIIGELADKPNILAYDADLHSGYVEPTKPSPDVARLIEAVRPFDAVAVEMFAQNYNASDVVLVVGPVSGIRLQFRDFLNLRTALAALEGKANG